ncbi:MAG: cytidine deaminase [Lachnospiraceae bacterium]|nr:cytidine deaminase [Lachnospiraceae bacterium]
MDNKTKLKLFAEALKARDNSYSPYSGFAVGAALLARDGKVYRGCNIENSSYGATICAERSAVCAAVSAGCTKGDFKAIAIAGGPKDGKTIPCPPCGICRQVLSEFADPETFSVVLESESGELAEVLLSELLPHVFSL